MATLQFTCQSAGEAFIITNFIVGTYASAELPVTLESNATNGSTCYFVLVPTSESAPTKEQVAAGTNAADGTPTAEGSGVWLDGSFEFDISDTIPLDSYRLYATISNGGILSDIAVSDPFDLITVADPRPTDSGVLYWFAADDTTLSGTDVVAINDKRGGFDLDTKPAAYSHIQQSSGGAPMVFAATRVLQTSTSSAGNRKMIEHLRGGGSLRVFLVVDAATLTSSAATFFSESQSESTNVNIRFGAYTSGGNIRFNGVGVQFSEAFAATTITSDNAVSTGLCVLEWKITQSSWETFIDGVSKGTGSVTPANFTNTATCRTTLGALASNTGAVQSAVGNFYEIYVTGTADDATADAIRTAIIAQYGIT